MDDHLVTDPGAVDAFDPDDILDESHIGYGFGPPGAPMETGAWFAANVNLPDLAVGDVLYVRAFNLRKSDITPANIGILCATVYDATGARVRDTVTQVMNPENYYFDNLVLFVCIPEPSQLLFIVPGLAIWALRRKK